MKKIISTLLTVSMLASTALIGVTSVTAADELPFDDVPAKWFKNAVVTVYNEGIMQGKSDTKFDPTANITRAEVVTAFARIACTNIDGKGDALTFTDTKTGKWYSDSVGWAADNGIVKGRGDGRFSPSDNITRAELASIIINFVNYMGLKLPDNPKIDKFSDAGTFANWMKEPVEAVRKTGLMQGVDGKFNPKGNATRAEIAQVIANLLPSTGRVNVVENGKTDYVIVIDEANSAAVDAAERIVWQLAETTGASIKVVDDGTKAAAKEIVLGTTDRGAKVDTSKMIKDEYAIAIDGEKVYIDGATANGVYGGAVNFMNTCTSGDDVRFTSKSAYTDKFEYPVKSLTIAGNDISKYTVYYPETENEEVITAAKDIAYYIEEATGVKIPVKTGTAKDYGIILNVVASDKKFDDSFTVKSEGSNIVISGHENRGVLYGAYDLLEQYVGVRYLMPEIDYVIPAESIDISDVDYAEAPTFEYRINCDPEYNANTPLSIKNKEYRNLVWGSSNVHTIDSLDGDFSSQAENQPCFTSDAVFEKVLEGVIYNLERDWFSKGEEEDVISISANDNINWCKCENCLASNEKYGGVSGTIIAFINRIAEELEDDYPNLKIQTLAYFDTSAAPKNIEVHPNVVIQFCPVTSCNNHPLDASCFYNKIIGQDIKDWSALVNEMYWWEYSFNWAYQGVPYPAHSYADIAERLQFLEKNNFNYIFVNGFGETGEYYYMHTYLQVKCMWDPYISEEEYYAYMTDFLKGYYGDGWELIYENIMTLEEKITGCVIAESTPAENMWHLYMRSYIYDLYDNMNEAKLMSVTKAEWERIDVATMQYEWIIGDIEFDSKYNSNDPKEQAEIQEFCTNLYAKFLKYGIRVSNNVENPPMPPEFKKSPSYWRDWAYLSVGRYDEDGNWIKDIIWTESELEG